MTFIREVHYVPVDEATQTVSLILWLPRSKGESAYAAEGQNDGCEPSTVRCCSLYWANDFDRPHCLIHPI